MKLISRDKMELKASEKQIKWIKHWLYEQNRDLTFYTNKCFEDLTQGEAGIIIGKAKKEINGFGFESTDEYIHFVKIVEEEEKKDRVYIELKNIMALPIEEKYKITLINKLLGE
jgi:hypothetical protein